MSYNMIIDFLFSSSHLLLASKKLKAEVSTFLLYLFCLFYKLEYIQHLQYMCLAIMGYVRYMEGYEGIKRDVY